MASYASRIRQDAFRWVDTGLIDRAAGEAIVRDVEARERKSLSFGSILAAMAALLVGAAILVFVAANWEAIPRLLRVASLFVVIFGGYVGGAVLKLYDHGAIGEAVWLVAAAAFGGSIALISQMYHLTGDETEAILTWCVGTGLAAAALRSSWLTIGAVSLAAFWLFSRSMEFWQASDFPHLFLGLAVALWLMSYWTQSVASRHLLLLSLIFYAGLLADEYDLIPIAMSLAAVSSGLFALAVLMPDAVERVVRLNGLLPVHCLIGFLLGIALVQIELGDQSVASFTVTSAVAFAGIVAAVVLAGRESRGLRWIAYVGFAIELCLVYGMLIGSMLGTAGFFLAAGVILGLLALGIIRVEKGMRGAAVPAGSAA